MCYKNKILTLPIKIQICIAIVALNLFCLLVILSICGSLAYEILIEDIKQKKLKPYIGELCKILSIFMKSIKNILKVVFISKTFVYYNMKK